MRLYWYWPFLRAEDIGLAEAVADDRVERLLVHTLDRPGVPADAQNERVQLRNDLPEVSDIAAGSIRWMGDRSRTYLSRRRLRNLETSGKHDLAHVWFLNRFTDSIDIPQLAKKGRLVANVHDISPHNRRLPDALSDAMLGRIYRSGARLIVHHPDLRERLIADFGTDADQVSVVPHMVRRRPQSTGETKRGNRVLFFGTLRHNKGLGVLLEAIDQSSSEIEWEIAGRGESDLEQAVAEADERHPNVVASIGHIDERSKAAAFDRADVVVLPYTAFDSQSGVLHDAYAHRVPVVVTDVGALGSTVREDGTGTVIKPGDPQALLAAVTDLLASRDRWTESVAACEKVATEREPEQIASLLHTIYAELR